MKTSKWVFSKTCGAGSTIVHLFFFTALLLTITSCKKEKNYPELEYSGLDLELLTPGSWWRYEWTKVDGTTGEITPLIYVDTVFVMQDTIVNGTTYKHLSGNYFGNMDYDQLMRDSLGYLVSQSGSILFSALHETDTAKISTWEYFTLYHIDKRGPESVTVPAGTFSAPYEHQVHYYKTDGSTWSCGTHWIKRKYFKKGIGLIYETEALIGQLEANCTYLQRSLTHYHIGH